MERMQARVLWGLLAIVVLALVAAGCGSGGGAGSGEEATGGSNTAAKDPAATASYAKEGDEICAKVPKRYAQRLKTVPKGKREDIATIIPKAAVPPLREAAEELDKLSAPESNAEEADEIVEALEEAADALEKVPQLGLEGPKAPFGKFKKLTKELGFKICGRL
jgi:hypothetical protein